MNKTLSAIIASTVILTASYDINPTYAGNFFQNIGKELSKPFNKFKKKKKPTFKEVYPEEKPVFEKEVESLPETKEEYITNIFEQLKNAETVDYSGNLETLRNNLDSLSFEEVNHIYKFLNSIKDSDFRNEISYLAKKDYDDKFTEYGGVVTFEDEFARLHLIESEFNKNNPNNKGWIPKQLPDKVEAYWHMHVAENYFLNRPSSLGKGNDMDAAKTAKTSCFLISLTKNQDKLNFDFFNGKKINGSYVVIDLGCIPYHKLDSYANR